MVSSFFRKKENELTKLLNTMAQATNVQRQQSLGDLERLLIKERPFEGGRSREARRMSDPRMDELDNILFKDFKSPPDIEKKHQGLIPHLLALDRIKNFMTSFLREKAKEIAGNGEGVTGTSVETDQETLRRTFRFRKTSDIEFQWRKMVLLNRLSVLSFLYELMMKSLRTRQETDEEKQRELLELSSDIASAQVVITDFQSKLSKCYEGSETTETELAQLRSKLDTIGENIEQTKIKAKFEINDEDLQQFCSVPSRICHALGLKIDFLHWFNFENFPDDVQNHMPFGDWICNFLRETYNEAIDDMPQTTLNDAQVLESIGFRPDGMALNTILARTSPLATHLELIDRAELFIRDEFKYNVVLSDQIFSRFPYDPLILNEWFPLARLSATQTSEAETLDFFLQPFCYAINLEQPEEKIESKLYQLHLEDENQTVLFHGTDHESAKDIIDQGIDINLGKQKRDFSDGAGFYLTNDLDYSVNWAFSKTSRPAVLVYRVSKEMLDSFSILSLCSEDKQTRWKEIVNQFRSGKPSKKLRKSLREIDFIEGPQASSSILPPIAREGSYQMCVISDKLAEELHNCIHSVLFWDGTITDL